MKYNWVYEWDTKVLKKHYPAMQVQCALTIVPSLLEIHVIQASYARPGDFWLGFTLAFRTIIIIITTRKLD